MISVITLANATIQLQLAWASAYVLLNIAHWTAAAMPRRRSWDFSAFEIKEQSIADGAKNTTYTDALWKTILVTKRIDWIKRGDLAPRSEVWNSWLDEAEHKSRTVSTRIGPIFEPIWGGDVSSKGIIWDAPDDWVAKDEWDRIYY